MTTTVSGFDAAIDQYLSNYDGEDCNWVHHPYLGSICGPSSSDRYANSGTHYEYRGVVFRFPPPIIRQMLELAGVEPHEVY